MKYFIVTGTSSGIGEAIAECLIIQKQKVFCISRRLNAQLTKLASEKHSGLWYYQVDLSNSKLITKTMREIFSYVDQETASGIALINNAGMLDPIGPVGHLNAQVVEQHLAVNLTAPLLLSNDFIRFSADFNIQKNIINISSGAAQHPYFGWSAYCSTKAGIDMLTQTIALEQKNKPYPVRAISVAPGIVDTAMQSRIRETTTQEFPMRPKFDALHAEKKLSDPKLVAQKIIDLIFCSKPESGSIFDLRDQ